LLGVFKILKLFQAEQLRNKIVEDLASTFDRSVRASLNIEIG